MLSVDLEGRFMNVMVANPPATGRQATSCLTGNEARKMVQASKATKPAPKTKASTKPAPADLEVK